MPYTNPSVDVPFGDVLGGRRQNDFLQNAQQQWATNPNNPANAGAAGGATPAPAAGAANPAPTDPQFANSSPTMENPSLAQYGFLDPNAWQNWNTFGGANPGGWASLGNNDSGQFGFMQQFQQMLGGGANPTSVAPTTPEGMQASMQPYIDSAYQSATRTLDPQVAQQNAQFEQQMINQGIPQGSEAYNAAKQQMTMAQNDAYAQAQNQAMQQGLQAQGQAFGQGLSQSQLASTLASSLLGGNTSLTGNLLGGNQALAQGQQSGNQSLFNQLIGGNTSLANGMLGLQGSMYGANQSAGATMGAAGMNHELGMAQLAQQGQQSDFNNMMSLFGLGSSALQYNNGLLDQSQHNAMSFFPYMPQGGGGNIDVTGPYGQQYQGQQYQYGIDQQNANAQNQAMMSAAMMAMMMCDREVKEGCVTLDISASDIIRELPVERWRYKGQPDIEHIGTYAQDFNKAIRKVGPYQNMIDPIDLFGFLLKYAKESEERARTLEARIAQLEAA